MMLCAQRSVARQAFLAIKQNSFRGGHRAMGIVATGARHRRAGLLLAGALRQRLELAGRAQAGLAVARLDVIPDIVGEIVTGPELVQALTRPLDRGIALQVTLHADGIAPIGRELRWIDDGPTVHMCGARPVTTLTGDAGVRENRHLVPVLGALDGRLNAAHVAVQARRQRRKIHGRFVHIAISRGHVPHVLVGVPVHRRLEQKSIHREQISPPAPSLPDVIQQLALASDRRIARALEAQPHLAALGVDAVAHSRLLMQEITCDQVVGGWTAGVCHGGALVGLEDRSMAFRAGLVAHVTVRVGFNRGRRGRLARGTSRRDQQRAKQRRGA